MNSDDNKILGRGVFMERGLVAPAFSENCVTVRKSILEQLIEKRDALQKHIEEISETIETMEKYPEIEKCLTQLSRSGIYR
jgi:hypothetical protein